MLCNYTGAFFHCHHCVKPRTVNVYFDFGIRLCVLKSSWSLFKEKFDLLLFPINSTVYPKIYAISSPILLFARIQLRRCVKL